MSHVFSELFVGESYRTVRLIYVFFLFFQKELLSKSDWMLWPHKARWIDLLWQLLRVVCALWRSRVLLVMELPSTMLGRSSNASGGRPATSRPTPKSSHLQVVFKIRHVPLRKLRSCCWSTSRTPHPPHTAFPLSSHVCDSVHRCTLSLAHKAYGAWGWFSHPWPLSETSRQPRRRKCAWSVQIIACAWPAFAK